MKSFKKILMLILYAALASSCFQKNYNTGSGANPAPIRQVTFCTSSECKRLPHPKSNKKVLLIGLDGIQFEQLMKANTPTIQGMHIALGKTGGIHGGYEQKTLSGPSWATILTGVWANKNDVKDNDATSSNSKYPNLFKVLYYLGYEVGSALHWPNIFSHFFQRDAALLQLDFKTAKPTNAADIYAYSTCKPIDETVTDKIINTIKHGNNGVKIDFLFMQADCADDIAHRKGFNPDYTQMMEFYDTQIKRMKEEIAKDTANDWLILITTDHGRNSSNAKYHGAQSLTERTVWFVSNKPLKNQLSPSDYNKKITFSDLKAGSVDVAATIYHFLGVKPKNADLLDGHSLLK